MRTIWFIRHAESQGNAGEKTDWPHTIALTKLGHLQAADLAGKFQAAPDLIVVSPYQRTTETARPTMERFPASPVVEWPIQEFTFLATEHYRGKTQEDRRLPAIAFWDRYQPDYCNGDGAESFNNFTHRVRHCLEQVRNSTGKFVAVFTHGYFIKGLLCELLYPGDLAPVERMQRLRLFHESYVVENTMILPVLAADDGQLFIGSPMAGSHRKGASLVETRLD